MSNRMARSAGRSPAN